ncbi:MAG: dihydropteroate synthase [Bacteroidota bacterium]
MQNTPFSTNKTLRLRDQLLDLTNPVVMGVINCTPDSFYAGSRHQGLSGFLKQAEKMIQEGATILDIGGYSSRPGADEVPEAEEVQRTVPMIGLLNKYFPQTPISIDTFRREVARQALDAGASIINDITAATHDDGMLKLAAEYKSVLVVMHMRGTPKTMGTLTDYNDLVNDVTLFLAQRVHAALEAGVTDVIIDPGFGFAKTPDQNFELMRGFSHFSSIGRPVLAGLSRKSMIWRTLDITPEEALNGTTVLNTIALMRGASILRVHDVREAVECVKLFSHSSH